MIRRTPVSTVLVFLLAAYLPIGCTEIQQAEQNANNARIDEAISRYHAAASQVHRGDSQEQVLAALRPSQAGLYSNEIKAPEAIPTETPTGEASLIEVFFFRSSRHADEAPTDQDGLPLSDNFTPYIFTDGVLTGIGWNELLAMKIKTPSHHEATKGDPCRAYGMIAGCF
jgi:hypothetical protein